MNAFRLSTSLPVFGLVMVLAGCGAQSGTNGTAGVADPLAAPAETSAKRDGFRGHGGGREFLLHAALREDLGLSDAQRKTIEAAIAEAEAARPAKTERPAVDRTQFTALAAAVRAGTVDPAKFTTVVPAAQKDAPNGDALKAHEAASAKALTTLHATLTPEQRRTLVDAISKHEGSHEKGEHGRRAQAPGSKSEGAKGERGERHHGGPLGHLLGGLDLTSAQQDAIRTKLDAQKPSDADHEAMKQKFEAMHAKMKERLQTFTADQFDAAAFMARPEGGNDKGKLGPMGSMNPVEHMAKQIAIITPVLTPAQREKLATRLEQGPPAHDRHEAK
jgi:Spy/CpxP family protein refolding chaperone